MKWPDDDIAYLRDNYPTMPAYELAERLGRSVRTIQATAKRYGIKKTFIHRPGAHRHSVNHAVFGAWTAETAYLIGLIMADGGVVDRRVGLYSSDRVLVDIAEQITNSTYPIKRAKPTVWVWEVWSGQMAADLAALGITPNKSRTIQLPPVPDECFWHLFRGYFDGDGGAYLRSRGNLELKLTSGSLALLEQLSTAVSARLDIEVRQVRERRGSRHGKPTLWYELHYHGLVALAIADAMYAGAETNFLPRKREVFDSYRTSPKRYAVGNATRYDKPPPLSDAERLARKREQKRQASKRYYYRQKAKREAF